MQPHLRGAIRFLMWLEYKALVGIVAIGSPDSYLHFVYPQEGFKIQKAHIDQRVLNGTISYVSWS